MVLRMVLGTARLVRLVPGCVLIAALLTACGSGASDELSGAAIQVVVSFYPLADAAQEVGGSLVQVENLTAPGVEPHDIELTPQQVESIDRADVVVYLGGGFQPAVEDALVDTQGTTLDASASLRSLPVPAGEADASLEADPHVWLDPTLYQQIVNEVRDVLTQVDPADASTFRSNAHAFDRRIGDLDRAYRSGLATCDRNAIVTSHAAFGYLAERYGLTQEAISGLSPDAEPPPQRLAEIKALVERDGITTIFTEELVSPRVADALATETGAATAVLNPLESLTPDEVAAGADYVSVMHENLSALRGALGCS